MERERGGREREKERERASERASTLPSLVMVFAGGGGGVFLLLLLLLLRGWVSFSFLLLMAPSLPDRHFVNRFLNPVDLKVPCNPHFIAKGIGVRRTVDSDLVHRRVWS